MTSYSGGWQLGDLDLSEHLAKYRDHEVVVIIASVGEAGQVEKEKYVCGICGFAMDEAGECPRCKLQNEEIAKGLRARQERNALFREIGDVVDEAWGEAGQEDGWMTGDPIDGCIEESQCLTKQMTSE